MDNEVSGQGNQYDYGFRIYNPRIARFLSVDPLTPAYPWYTPYQFAGNKPIVFIDLDGLEECDPDKFYKKNRTLIRKTIESNINKLPASEQSDTKEALNTAFRRLKLFDFFRYSIYRISMTKAICFRYFIHLGFLC